jgi:hypothetical protein
MVVAGARTATAGRIEARLASCRAIVEPELHVPIRVDATEDPSSGFGVTRRTRDPSRPRRAWLCMSSVRAILAVRGEEAPISRRVRTTKSRRRRQQRRFARTAAVARAARERTAGLDMTTGAGRCVRSGEFDAVASRGHSVVTGAARLTVVRIEDGCIPPRPKESAVAQRRSGIREADAMNAAGAPRASSRDPPCEQGALLGRYEPRMVGAIERREDGGHRACLPRVRCRLTRTDTSDGPEIRVRAPVAGRRKTCVAAHALRTEERLDDAAVRDARAAIPRGFACCEGHGDEETEEQHRAREHWRTGCNVEPSPRIFE